MPGTATEERLLFFDVDPDICFEIEELADEMRVFVATASEVGRFEKLCSEYAPDRIIIGIDGPEETTRALLRLAARAGVGVPLLLTGRHDISVEAGLIAFAAELDLDVRGTVVLGASRRDLQFALLWVPTAERAA